MLQTSRFDSDPLPVATPRRAPHMVTVRSRTPYRHQQLRTMLAAFGQRGGVVTADALVDRVRHHHDQPLSMVARWVVQRSIVSFEWRGQMLLPLFQFDRDTILPSALLTATVAALNDAFDNWDAALWFASPNAWFADATPVARWGSHPSEVLEAARADCSIAKS